MLSSLVSEFYSYENLLIVNCAIWKCWLKRGLNSINWVGAVLWYLLQNFISVLIVSALSVLGVVSTEPLTWKLIKVWLPVNFIFVGMLVTSMFRYVGTAIHTRFCYICAKTCLVMDSVLFSDMFSSELTDEPKKKKEAWHMALKREICACLQLVIMELCDKD